MGERADGKVWVECWNCGGEGDIEGDCTCGEDTCCCIEPDAPICSHCHGKGGYFVVPEFADDRG